MKYPEQLKTEEWAEKRASIFRRDGYRCLNCGNGGNLECHHKAYNRNGFIWQVPDDWLETLCAECHERRTEIEREIRMIPTSEFFEWWEDANKDLERIYTEAEERASEKLAESENETVFELERKLSEQTKLLNEIEIEESIARANNPYCIEAYL